MGQSPISALNRMATRWNRKAMEPEAALGQHLRPMQGRGKGILAAMSCRHHFDQMVQLERQRATGESLIEAIVQCGDGAEPARGAGGWGG